MYKLQIAKAARLPVRCTSGSQMVIKYWCKHIKLRAQNWVNFLFLLSCQRYAIRVKLKGHTLWQLSSELLISYGKPWITLNGQRIIQYHWQSILQRQLSIPLKPVHVQTPVAWSVDRHITVLCAPEAHSTRIQWHLNHRCMGSRFFSIIAWKL